APVLCAVPAAPALLAPSLHDALPIFGPVCHVVKLQRAQADDLQRRVTLRAGDRVPQFDALLQPDSGEALRAPRLDPASCSVLARSEEHTSELQSRENLVCRLLLEKKK